MRIVAGRRAAWTLLGLGLVLGFGQEARAANRYTVDATELLVQGQGQTITVRLDNDFDLYAFTLSLKYEQARLRVTGAELVGDAANPVWKDIKFNNTNGELVVGVILVVGPEPDLDPKLTNFLPPGTNREVLRLTVDVLVSTAGTTFLDFRDGLGSGQIKINNRMTNAAAASITPTAVDRTLTIRSLKPEISSISPNEGRPGTRFFVSASNLDLAGLNIALEVCGTSIPRDVAGGFSLTADKRSLDVIAPACATVGFVPVKVVTNHGEDVETNGFEYLPDLTPVIVSLTGNTGQPGKQFQVTGTNFNRPGLAVKVCGNTATASLRGDGTTLDVTAPSCPLGWAVLEVCTNEGCDTETNGFNYQPSTGNSFLLGNCNADTLLDISDAVYLLAHLFTGGPAPPCAAACNSNSDASTDVSDPIYTLNFLFGGGAAPRAPFPECDQGAAPECSADACP